MELGTFDYSQLPVDLRLFLLGLPAGRRRGRPRALTFLERVGVAQAWSEALNGHAVHVHDRKRDRAMARLQKKFRDLCAAKASPYRIAEVTAAIDKIGRVTRVAIKPPDTVLPEIDKQVAKLFGITERMVQKCRTDPRLRQFMQHPVWLERDWEKSARLIFEARQVAATKKDAYGDPLMTPERLAKREPLEVFNGTIRLTAGGDAHDEVYLIARRLFRLAQRLECFVPLEYRSRPRWLGFRPQWPRIVAQEAGLHPARGRVHLIRDYEAEKCSQEYWANKTR
jgi:hypothetical protein